MAVVDAVVRTRMDTHYKTKRDYLQCWRRVEAKFQEATPEAAANMNESHVEWL